MDPRGRDELLELARDLSHNKGMSLLFSSHLLPDVEAVCDQVMVLDRGRLKEHGRIADLKERHQGYYEVRVKADQEHFARALASAGCATEPKEDLLLVKVPPPRNETIFWETAAATGLQIRHLRPRRSTLEEVFEKALAGEEE